MKFFRSREIKKMCIAMIFIGVVLTGVGFAFHPVAGGAAFSTSIIFLCIFLFYTKKRYDAIADLTFAINQVLHGANPDSISDNQEGELYILKSELGKMASTLMEQAEALNQDKVFLSEVLSDISHQLKMPLTSMNLISSLMRKSDLSEAERMGLLRDMVNLLSRMDWLVASLLKISKMDAGTVYFKKEDVFVHEIVLAAAKPLQIAMEIKRQKFSILGDENLAFLGDRSWTTEAIGNILKNCMEHTPECGRIDVRYEQTSIYTSIIVEDTGTGISEGDLPHIFERFYQCTDSTGIGIGLALTRMIIVQQGGTIKAENRREGGSRFAIKFYRNTV